MTVPNPRLEGVLGSAHRLGEVWPTTLRQAQVLLHLLRICEPSLDTALRIGLLSAAMTKPARETTIVVTYKEAVLTAVARDADGAPVPSPLEHPETVKGIDVLDLEVAGVPALTPRQGKP